MQIYALNCGNIELDFKLIMRDKPGRVMIPVPAWLIIHPKGKVLFDSGFHMDAADPDNGRLGRLSSILDVRLKPENKITEQLAQCQIDVDDIDFLINSHLHTDHCGGNEYVKNATLVLQKREYQAGSDSDFAEKSGYVMQDYQHGHPKKLICGEHDLFGDGRLLLIPTYGHTHGHQSLLVRLDDGRQILLCADACYFQETLQRMIAPLTCSDEEAFMQSLQHIKKLQQRGVILYYGHDPIFWNSLATAPNPL